MLLIAYSAIGQGIVINEVISSNVQNRLDEDGDTPDWIELYNAGPDEIDLEGYELSDKMTPATPWVFPPYRIAAGGHLLVFASDKDRSDSPLHWTTLIDAGDEWSYVVPSSEPDAAWRTAGFDDSSWESGKTSIGYGDGDDSTVVHGALSVFMRKTFEVTGAGSFHEGLLHMDYDDGFIAYLNGVEIARSGLSDAIPPFDATANGHEAVIFSGGVPESFEIQDLASLLQEGTNVLCVQVHNTSSTSSDMTAIPILSLASTEDMGGDLSDYVVQVQSSFHTNFKVSSDGDSIILRNSNQEVVDLVVIGALAGDISYGRATDGAADWGYFQEPTPGSENNTTAYQNFSGEVTFSIAPGHYSTSIVVELMADAANSDIHYTTDGSVPTVESTSYVSPVLISSSTSLRARAIEPDKINGPVTTATYLINSNHDLPIVSLTVDPYDFFDYEYGMYERGPNASPDFPHFDANFWQDWERPVFVEFFEPDGELGFSVRAGAKIFGGWSRGQAQKSLSLFFRKGYGDGPIDYPVFPGKELTEFSSLVLRNSGNDWNNTMMRDGLLTSLFHESVDRQAFRPAVVYINGEYWGIQNIREKVNEHFLANNHGIDRQTVALLEGRGAPVFGNEEHYHAMISFVENNDLSNDDNYRHVASQMDIDNFIFYMTGNIFVDNQDWPGNNIKFWREDTETGKWRWITYDTDFGFGIWDPGNYTNNTLAFALERFGPDWPNPPWATLLLRSLMDNEQFKNRFINLFADQLNTTFSEEYVKAQIDQKSGAIQSEIENHMNRWYGDLGYWYGQIESYSNYAENRPDRVSDHIRSTFGLTGDYDLTVDATGLGQVRLNSLVLEDFPWEGTYFNDVPISLEAIPAPGYEFVRWEGISSTSASAEVDSNIDLQVNAVFERISNFSAPVVINEINFSLEGINDWVELHNPGTTPYDISGWTMTDDNPTHVFEFPEGTEVAANGYLVVCRDQLNFWQFYPSTIPTVGDIDFGLSGNGDCVRLISAEGVTADEVCYEPGAPWPQIPEVTGAAIALSNPLFNNNVGENWHIQVENGNPGAANETLIANVAEDFDTSDLQIFPNPFNSQLNIRFDQRTSGVVYIDVLDLQGRVVAEVFQGYVSSGATELSWQPKGVRSGIYLVRMITESGISIQKVRYADF